MENVESIEMKAVVLLSKSPWHIRCANESDAINVCSNYKDHVLAVASSESSIVIKEVKQQLSLFEPEVKMISHQLEAVIPDLLE